MFIPIPSNDDPCLDLFRHMCLVEERVPATPDAPAFTYGKNSFINYKQFTSKHSWSWARLVSTRNSSAEQVQCPVAHGQGHQ